MSINRVTLAGFTGKDARSSCTQNGRSMTKLSVATTKRYKDAQLEGMLLDLASERKEAGHSYGWYVTVALQRIHGISPERLRKMRGRVKSGASGPAPVASREEIARKPPAVVEVEQLKEQIRALPARGRSDEAEASMGRPDRQKGLLA
jgi:hypothetical protein